jgi:hypothetical protein
MNLRFPYFMLLPPDHVISHSETENYARNKKGMQFFHYYSLKSNNNLLVASNSALPEVRHYRSEYISKMNLKLRKTCLCGF